MAQSRSLSTLVFRNYLRSALIPVLTIELLLVITYFLVNAWNTNRTANTLRKELTTALPFLAENRAEIIDASLSRVAAATRFFAEEHQRLETAPQNYVVTGEPVQVVRAPNGTRYQPNRKDGSSLYYPTNAPLSARQLLIGERSASLDPLYKHMVTQIPNVAAAYYNTWDNTNRLYPYIEKVWEQYPATLQMTDYNFYYMADSLHNPKRTSAWTGAYLDPAGQGWMVSCVAPVHLGRDLKGVVGLDLTIANIVNGLLSLKFPWGASAFLADDSGMILAMPPKVEDALGLHELKGHVYNEAVKKEQLKPQDYNLFRNPDSSLSQRFRRMYQDKDTVQSIELNGEEVFLIQKRIPQTGWRIFLMARSTDVFQSVREVSRRSHQIGYAVIALMLGFYVTFFLYLRRKAREMASQMATPLTQLAQATSRLGTQESIETFPMQGIDEIDQLTTNFNTLSSELESRSKELVDSQVHAQIQAKEGELAYARGQYESASGYLHNVGNLTTRLASDIMDLQTLLKSTEQFPEVFRRIREGNDPKMLDNLETVLTTRMVPRLRSATEDIEDVRDCIHRTIAHQQSAFLDGQNELIPTRFSLSELLEHIGHEFAERAISQGIELSWKIAPGIEITNHKDQIYHGLVNLVKNSMEAISGTGTVSASLERTTHGSRIVIGDTGCGLNEAELTRVLTAGFTTKSGGHGLGLHSFSVFLSSHSGRLQVASPGKGQGCHITIEFSHD
ncbi:MAG: hypothetical protein RL318_1962 [Fibrobacterota bacterium]|jgi:signal transduction histidine kinase